MRNTKQTHKITVIIPAHNEEKNIGKVLQALQKNKYTDETICIDDGSTDNTLEIIKKYPSIKAISFARNRGKAFALMRGIVEAKGEIVVFVDADLKGVTEETVARLLSPLCNEACDAVVGYIDRRFDKPFIPVMGERAYFKKDLLPLLPLMRRKGYGVELFLNYHFCRRKVAVVALPHIKHMQKYEKQPYNTVARLFVKEAVDIVKEIFRQENPPLYLKQTYLDNFYINRLSKESL